MLVHRDMRYRVTRRLELARHKLFRWNWHQIGDIFRHVEDVEANTMELQCRKDQEGASKNLI